MVWCSFVAIELALICWWIWRGVTLELYRAKRVNPGVLSLEKSGRGLKRWCGRLKSCRHLGSVRPKISTQQVNTEESETSSVWSAPLGNTSSISRPTGFSVWSSTPPHMNSQLSHTFSSTQHNGVNLWRFPSLHLSFREVILVGLKFPRDGLSDKLDFTVLMTFVLPIYLIASPRAEIWVPFSVMYLRTSSS